MTKWYDPDVDFGDNRVPGGIGQNDPLRFCDVRLDDKSESATLKFKDGRRRSVARQMAASPCQKIEITDKLREKYNFVVRDGLIVGGIMAGMPAETQY